MQAQTRLYDMDICILMDCYSFILSLIYRYDDSGVICVMDCVDVVCIVTML